MNRKKEKAVLEISVLRLEDGGYSAEAMVAFHGAEEILWGPPEATMTGALRGMADAIDRYREEHPEVRSASPPREEYVCPCGEGKATPNPDCWTCKGTGVTSEQYRECPNCGGEGSLPRTHGVVVCSVCKGGGNILKVPAPMTLEGKEEKSV